MKITSSMLLNIMLLTILSASFFLVSSTASNYETTSVEYNPWRDLNDDGIIDIYDVVMVTGIYRSTGTPINKTALLYNVNDTFTQLLDRIEILESDRTDLFNLYWQLYNLYGDLQANQTQVYVELDSLQDLCDELDQNKLGVPDYDSEWTALAKGDNSFGHPLGTTDVIVYIVGKKTWGGAIHQIEYGGEKSTIIGQHGVFWYKLTETEITVYRNNDDGNWEYVRVMLWKIP